MRVHEMGQDTLPSPSTVFLILGFGQHCPLNTGLLGLSVLAETSGKSYVSIDFQAEKHNLRVSSVEKN